MVAFHYFKKLVIKLKSDGVVAQDNKTLVPNKQL